MLRRILYDTGLRVNVRERSHLMSFTSSALAFYNAEHFCVFQRVLEFVSARPVYLIQLIWAQIEQEMSQKVTMNIAK